MDLDHLRKKHRPSCRKLPASANVPPIHIHFSGKPPLCPLTNLQINNDDSGGDTEPDSDYENDLTVPLVLDDIHAEYPALNMPQYAAALTMQGIIYATSVSDFDRDFYVDIVKMTLGAAELLIRETKKALGKRRSTAKGKKRAVAVCWNRTRVSTLTRAFTCHERLTDFPCVFLSSVFYILFHG